MTNSVGFAKNEYFTDNDNNYIKIDCSKGEGYNWACKYCEIIFIFETMVKSLIVKSAQKTKIIWKHAS